MSASTGEKLRAINAVLRKLACDDDLRDDLKLPIVQAAINHWTGKNRLGPEQAAKLQDHRRVVYVLQRFQMLQSVCKEALMPVPLDHLLLGKTELDESIVRQFLPQALASSSKGPTPSTTVKGASVQNGSKVTKGTDAELKPEKVVKMRSNRSSSGKQDSSVNDGASVPVGSAVTELSAATNASSEALSKSISVPPVDINTMLKIAIAVVVGLTAVTVSVLLNRHQIV